MERSEETSSSDAGPPHGSRPARIDVFADLMQTHGVAEHIRSDNGPEMIAKNLRRWLTRLGTTTMYIRPGSPWENGYCEPFNGKIRVELLNGELFYAL